MKQRNPIGIALLSIVTLGIYYIVWLVKTKGEMVEQGAEIPTSWLLIIPFVNIWWLFKYCQGVEKVTGGQTSAALGFVLLWLLSIIGQAIIQDGYNKIGAPASSAVTPPPPPPSTPPPPAPA